MLEDLTKTNTTYIRLTKIKFGIYMMKTVSKIIKQLCSDPKKIFLIDNIESLTGIDFFSGLSDDIENKLESTINTSSWSW